VPGVWTGLTVLRLSRSTCAVRARHAARFDAVKHNANAVVGDARETLVELAAALDGWSADAEWAARAAEEKAAWDVHIDLLRAGGHTPDGSLTYAQVTGVVNETSTPDDYVLTASGGMPGELYGGWRTGEIKPGAAPTSGATMDLEYGFSCMGYEVVDPWGAAMAREKTHPDGVVTSIFGDGSYLMLNSEIYSAAVAGHPYVAVVCDNGGTPSSTGSRPTRAPSVQQPAPRLPGPGADGSVHVDFAAHAAALGAPVEDVRGSTDIEDLRAAYLRARAAARAQRRPAVVVCRVHHATWTEAGAWWETGVPPRYPAAPRTTTASSVKCAGCEAH
jgi:3D-(3,5/4)-trihydroxycyclohexane-1,2-dione acylhydrolase (decyclizing)